MAQYKHDRFFKLYVQALYKTKGETRKNIKVMNDEELEIDGLPTESLTEEEQDFMRTMEQVDAWLEAEISEAQQDAKLKQAQSLVLRQLNRRVGNVPSETEARVQSLSLARLEQLGEDLLDFGQMGDLIGWLDIN